MDRRTVLCKGAASLTMPVVGLSSLGCTQAQQGDRRNAVRIHFLEIVTPDVDSACSLYSMMYGVTFGDPDQD
ncbi:MAG: hypothetical protein PVH89_13260, partial [Gammaproteobacteria bacterium]